MSYSYVRGAVASGMDFRQMFALVGGFPACNMLDHSIFEDSDPHSQKERGQDVQFVSLCNMLSGRNGWLCEKLITMSLDVRVKHTSTDFEAVSRFHKITNSLSDLS